MAWVRVSSSARQRGEGRVTLEALCESGSTFCSELVVVEPAGKKMCLLFSSAGADAKVNAQEPVRKPSLLERAQRRVALEALGERGASFWSDVIVPETADKISVCFSVSGP